MKPYNGKNKRHIYLLLCLILEFVMMWAVSILGVYLLTKLIVLTINFMK